MLIRRYYLRHDMRGTHINRLAYAASLRHYAITGIIAATPR